MKHWRTYLKAIAIVVNGVFALWLLVSRGWWMPIGYLGGVPFIIPPIIAIISLVAMRGDQRDS